LSGRKPIGDRPVCLILGRNRFLGHGLPGRLKSRRGKVQSQGGAVVFGYHVRDPKRYGVVESDLSGKASSIEEKPKHPKSDYAVTGLCFYGNDVVDIAKSLKPSARGELEITDLNWKYLERDALSVELLKRGHAWLDTGTHDSLLECSEFVAAAEGRQSRKIGCVEEIAYCQDSIGKDQLGNLAERFSSTTYGKYPRSIAEEEHAV
jgi:glucose-1-phosphate thymidylyltransferase